MKVNVFSSALVALAAALPLSLVPGQAQDPFDESFALGPTIAETRRTIEFRGLTMGATFSVKVVTGQDGLDSARHSELDRAIRTQLGRIDRLMSTWDSDSELSRFNRSASLEPFPVSLETFEVLTWSIDLAALTGGALDVTIAPLVDAWGFGPDGPRNGRPSDEEIARLREATGAGRLELDSAALTVRKARPDVRCDLSALAPGYAADRLWAELAARGFPDFLVDVGGELRTRGRNDAGEPWQIAIERPQAQGHAVQQVVPISNLAIATSGDYRRYREVDGQRVAHILDPRTGQPLAHRLASVTVIDELAVRADGLATALMVLGSEEGIALAEKLDLAALFIERTNEGFSERATSRFEEITSPLAVPSVHAFPAVDGQDVEQRRLIDAALPSNAPATPKQRRLMLVFNLQMRDGAPWKGPSFAALPAQNYALEQMGRRTGAYDVIVSSDIEMFRPGTIEQFDAICFCNTLGVLFDDPELQKSLLAFVAGGRGIVGIHDALATFVQYPRYDQWPEFGRMLGGTENGGHPWDGVDMTIRIDDPDHPINAMFGGQDFTMNDQAFQLQEPAIRDRLRVLLSIDPDRTVEPRRAFFAARIEDRDFPMSWIKAHGEGRVFYSVFGHHAHVFWNPDVLKHFLAGIQYALGDLDADDTPSAQAAR